MDTLFPAAIASDQPPILTFARRRLDNALVHVDDVSNGLACECACPCCGSDLVARQGTERAHSFAHVGSRDCKGGPETALHLAAKAILMREGRIVLPGLEVTESVKDANGQLHPAKASLPVECVKLKDVADEIRFGGLHGVKPDITANINGGMGSQLFVEVAVTHFADKEKRLKLAADGHATIEIDISRMVGDWNWVTLTQAVVDATEAKAWLFNPRETALREQARAEAQALADAADKQLGRDGAIGVSKRSAGRIAESISLSRKSAIAKARAHNMQQGVEIDPAFGWVSESQWPEKEVALKVASELSGKSESAFRNPERGWGRLARITTAVRGLSVDEVVWIFREDIEPRLVFDYLRRTGFIRRG